MAHKKNKIKINKWQLLRTVVVVIVVVMVGMSVKNILFLSAENKKLEKEKTSLEKERNVLKEELENVNDKDYIEEQARIQLRMIKPGEIIYILQEEEDGEESN